MGACLGLLTTHLQGGRAGAGGLTGKVVAVVAVKPLVAVGLGKAPKLGGGLGQHSGGVAAGLAGSAVLAGCQAALPVPAGTVGPAGGQVRPGQHQLGAWRQLECAGTPDAGEQVLDSTNSAADSAGAFVRRARLLRRLTRPESSAGWARSAARRLSTRGQRARRWRLSASHPAEQAQQVEQPKHGFNLNEWREPGRKSISRKDNKLPP